MADFTQRLLHEIADLRRQIANQHREGPITDVKGDRIRFAIGKDENGEDIKSPWIHTHNHRGGARARAYFKKGQNVLAFAPGGDLMRAVIMPHAPNKEHRPPDHANKSGQKEETYQYEQTRERRKKDSYELWHEEPQQKQGEQDNDDDQESDDDKPKEINWDKVTNYIKMSKDGLVIKSKKPILMKVGDSLKPEDDEKGTWHKIESDKISKVVKDKTKDIMEADKITQTVNDGQKIEYKEDQTKTTKGKILHESKNIGKDHVHKGVQPGAADTQDPEDG
jgi:hypothetical protein